jgi:hypothetical protein
VLRLDRCGPIGESGEISVTSRADRASARMQDLHGCSRSRMLRLTPHTHKHSEDFGGSPIRTARGSTRVCILSPACLIFGHALVTVIHCHAVIDCHTLRFRTAPRAMVRGASPGLTAGRALCSDRSPPRTRCSSYFQTWCLSDRETGRRSAAPRDFERNELTRCLGSFPAICTIGAGAEKVLP